MNDPMSMYKSVPRKHGSVVTQAEIEAKKQKSEWSEQLHFCKWLKREYPDVLFRSDEQNQGQRSYGMQNIMQVIDPYRRGWPDIMIFHPSHGYSGLMIELKAVAASLSTPHAKEQMEMHDKLRKKNWMVYFAFGCEDAKQKFQTYMNPPNDDDDYFPF